MARRRRKHFRGAAARLSAIFCAVGEERHRCLDDPATARVTQSSSITAAPAIPALSPCNGAPKIPAGLELLGPLEIIGSLVGAPVRDFDPLHERTGRNPLNPGNRHVYDPPPRTTQSLEGLRFRRRRCLRSALSPLARTPEATERPRK